MRRQEEEGRGENVVSGQDEAAASECAVSVQLAPVEATEVPAGATC